MKDFFAMGGYGAFVWPCFLLAAVFLIGNVIAAQRLLDRERDRASRREDARRNPS